ncbi:MAG: AMP-binding protein [Desulfovibrio sp.]|nr:AMP-binding protein [Desulfovibrio sp.]
MHQDYDVESFRDSFEHEFTWLNGFLRNTGRFGGRTALSDPESGRKWTYRELNRDANRLAHALRDLGVRKGDIVMYMLFNSPEFALCYIACHKLGAIGCPINFRLAPGEVALQIDDSRPRAFIYDAQFGQTVREALEMAAWKPEHVIETSMEKRRASGQDDFDLLMENRPESNPQPEARQHIYDETTRLYTSGTTNKAKAVPLNCINEVLSAHDVIMHFPLNPTDKTMNMTPWFHRGGLHSGGLTPTLYAGGEVVALREFNPRKCLELVEQEGITFLVGVPSIIALLARGQKWQPADLSSLKGIVTMGSPFEKGACKEYMELLTPNIFNGYGTTETFWNTFLRPYDLPEMAGTAGQSCTDDDVRVIRIRKDGGRGDPDELASRDGAEVGEVVIRAPGKSAGSYVNNPEMTAQKFHRGFHYTGDLATWDENEFITVVGRKDDMILNAGENVYPTQVEEILNAHPGVAEAAVVGVPDRRHGESIAAYIVPANEDLSIADLKEYCLQNPLLPAFKRPRHYAIVSELPHTATGKLLHYKIREMAAREFGPASRE